MIQFKYPERTVFIAGDRITFRLDHVPEIDGTAFLRTNIGGVEALRQEEIALNESKLPRHGLAWRDLPMSRDEKGGFVLELPLVEIGVFEAKCGFAPADGGKILWPEGGNFRIKVESAANLCGNTLYCAFVRQFNFDASRTVAENEETAQYLDRQGYTVIPPSGTFRSLKKHLDHIFGTLGCGILQLLPVHPVPAVYGRMGRYGSPFASLDYFAVDPALADFDKSATPMEQFLELLDAVHARSGRLFLDIPVNHTGWASQLQRERPEFFVRREDGTFESPGAWGVVWEDLCKLNYEDAGVARFMAEVFLHWCRLGVDGFRCDAGYMLPAGAWDYIVAKVRQEYPDTVFLLEGLGGMISVQEKLLIESGLDWAYSELFQNYSRDEISRYQPYIENCSHNFGTLINFAETHDNLRLAAQSPEYAAMRCALCALLSSGGSFGFANGVEFCATERIDVHGNGSLNWNGKPDIVPLIGRLNALLSCHKAFFSGSKVQLVQRGPGNLVAALRESADDEAKVLAVVNLDMNTPAQAHWAPELFCGNAVDLLSGREMTIGRVGDDAVVYLAPGEALCLSLNRHDLNRLVRKPGEPEAVTVRRAEVMAHRIWLHFRKAGIAGYDCGEALRREPMAYCRETAGNALPGVTRYYGTADLSRMVMLPAGDLLLAENDVPFRMELHHGKKVVAVERSIPRIGGAGHFAVLDVPVPENGLWRELSVHLTIYGAGESRRLTGRMLQLAKEPGNTPFAMSFKAEEIAGRNLHAFSANDRGGMTLAPAAWGTLFSKYDALLAANGSAPYPVDRRVMFTRLRGWLVADEYSQELNLSVMSDFAADGRRRARWRFMIPSGRGRLTPLDIELAGAEDGDALKLVFHRGKDAGTGDSPDVKIILRPDVEDRSNHLVTKAFQGAEKLFPRSVTALKDGFKFAPGDLTLTVQMKKSRFVSEPEWKYMVNLPLEDYYGQEHCTDLFSPGYLEFELGEGEQTVLFAAVTDTGKKAPSEKDFHWHNTGDFAESAGQLDVLRNSMGAFVVKRDKFRTVIAGYPWFLDWGRDTLIALRGLIAGGYKEIASDILRQFASFEEKGTIPNIIHGNTVGNRDTSDAPLWLGVAARDYIDFYNDESIMEADCAGRSFREVVFSIIRNYLAGTPNGIKADPDSLLVFSPPHFTWMDTNYPAGTPREGYPIEIQSLWYATLKFASRYSDEYKAMAEKVQNSIEKYFFLPELNRFSDCLHCAPGMSAALATADDHIRCNQLLALTLGAVEQKEKQLAILDAAEKLLIPGSIRSLADQPVRFALPVYHNGRLLNNPEYPYQGYYRGGEDDCRKMAYHNGTAWGWVFPSYCEALLLVGGEAQRRRALTLLESVAYMADRGVPGQLPEISGGHAPHNPEGCPVQAWSVTEAFRVMLLLS